MVFYKIFYQLVNQPVLSYRISHLKYVVDKSNLTCKNQFQVAQIERSFIECGNFWFNEIVIESFAEEWARNMTAFLARVTTAAFGYALPFNLHIHIPRQF